MSGADSCERSLPRIAGFLPVMQVLVAEVVTNSKEMGREQEDKIVDQFWFFFSRLHIDSQDYNDLTI
jgi:hypothetical protein